MQNFVIIFFIISFSALAQEAGTHVLEMDKVDSSSLKHKNIKIHKRKNVKQFERRKTSSDFIEEAFIKSKVISYITHLDSIDRALLYSKSSYLDIKELKKQFPEIPEKQLKTLQQISSQKIKGKKK